MPTRDSTDFKNPNHPTTASHTTAVSTLVHERGAGDRCVSTSQDVCRWHKTATFGTDVIAGVMRVGVDKRGKTDDRSWRFAIIGHGTKYLVLKIEMICY